MYILRYIRTESPKIKDETFQCSNVYNGLLTEEHNCIAQIQNSPNCIVRVNTLGILRGFNKKEVSSHFSVVNLEFSFGVHKLLLIITKGDRFAPIRGKKEEN